MTPHLTLHSLPEALAELRKLEKAPHLKARGNWSLYQIFTHCAQSIEYSMSRYPRYKPMLFRKTIGRIALHTFIRQGYMNHDVHEPVPDAPTIEREGDMRQALKRLINAIEDFLTYQQAPALHFAFDKLSKEQYSRIHAMHIANHLAMIEIQ